MLQAIARQTSPTLEVPLSFALNIRLAIDEISLRYIYISMLLPGSRMQVFLPVT